ncbi:MAG: hypothetical protein HY000_33175 [Planctomycetes bacterium]|nr:hypothetical protein [Planctomycetota bacterium]
MTRLTIEEAQAKLPELIGKLAFGEEVLITEQNQPVARLVGQRAKPVQPRQPGSAIGILTIVAEDDEHLEDFKEYMPCG